MKITIRLILFVALWVLSVSVMSQADKLQIVASHSILGDVVSNVAGDVADVTSLIPAGVDAHAFQPTPSDLTAIAKADVVFVNGAFFEEGLLQSIENAGEDIRLVEASSCVEILSFGVSQPEQGSDPNHDAIVKSDMNSLCDKHMAEIENYHADDDYAQIQVASLGRLIEVDCGAGRDREDEHIEGNCDPHVWMNPNNVIYWAMLIRDTLIELDPANTDSYKANADRYLVELDRLVDEFVIPLVETLPQDKRILVASHNSLGYLTTTFGFKTVGTIIQSGSTLAQPSVQDVANIIDLVRAEGVPAIFGETTVNNTITQTIADETGAELVILYSGSLSDEDGPAPTYLDYIRYNYTVIIEALGGGS